MIKIENKLASGIISGFLGMMAIMLSNSLFVRLGLVQHSLNTMSLQVVNCRKLIPLSSKRDIWSAYGISIFFCTTGGILITHLLSNAKRLRLLKGFLLGIVGGLIPFVFKQIKVIKDIKRPISKAMCLLSHGFFGLTVALVTRTIRTNN